LAVALAVALAGDLPDDTPAGNLKPAFHLCRSPNSTV
jgi:hypothetical protein